MANFNNVKTGYIGNAYDGDDLSMVVDGELMYGFAAGSTAVEYADDNDNVSTATDLQGSSFVSKNHKQTGKFTVNLNQMSPSNKKLTELLNTQAEFSVDYRNSSDHVYSEHCLITKHPNVTTADTAGTAAWTIVALDRTIENVIGG